MAKRTSTGIGGTGIMAAVRDLFQVYAGWTGKGTLVDDGTVAIVGIDANEIAPMVDVTGVAASTIVPVGTTTFVSGVVLTQGFARIIGTYFANNSGNVHIQQSSDGTNFDSDTSVAVVGGTGGNFSVEVIAPYARVTFVPTGSNTTLRLFPFLRRL